MKQNSLFQIPFDFDLSQEMIFENFYSIKNKQLLIHLQKVAKGRGDSFTYLWGKTGVGKTHLLQSCMNMSNEKRLSCLYLPLANKDHLKIQIFDNLESLYLVCIDDLDRIVGDELWEKALFDFYNKMMESRKRLIIASREPPAQLSFKLPDLKSRLSSGLIYQVYELSETETLSAFAHRAKQLGIILSDSVLHYLITHYPRDLGSLITLLSDLDKTSLQLKRKITIPFINQYAILKK